MGPRAYQDDLNPEQPHVFPKHGGIAVVLRHDHPAHAESSPKKIVLSEYLGDPPPVTFFAYPKVL